jgi:hypothetical protein
MRRVVPARVGWGFGLSAVTIAAYGSLAASDTMQKTLNIIAVIGLGLGSVFGLAGTMVPTSS